MIRTQTRVLQLPRTVTAPTSSTQSFLFRPAARAHSISLGQTHGYIQAPQVVQVVQLAGPKEEEAEVTQEDEPVKGPTLEENKERETDAEQGAAFLEEVTTNAEELATALQLTGEQSLRFQARLRALPPPKFAAPAQVPKVRKKLPVAAAPCPCCNKEDRMLWNVTIASQHEGWGRKWNECAYACQLCRRHISRQLHVNACRDCKVMWHPDCEQALAKDQACVAMDAESESRRRNEVLRDICQQARYIEGHHLKHRRTEHTIVSQDGINLETSEMRSEDAMSSSLAHTEMTREAYAWAELMNVFIKQGISDGKAQDMIGRMRQLGFIVDKSSLDLSDGMSEVDEAPNLSDVEEKQQEDYALHLAALNGQQDLAEILVKRGADKESKTPAGETALHLAVQNGHEGVVALLVHSGADTEAKTAAGKTALHLAAQKGGETALHLAALNGDVGVVEFLVEQGADKEAKTAGGKMALHLAAQKGHRNMVRFLLKAGADMEAKTAADETALHLAVQNRLWGMVKFLVEEGADKEAATAAGETALHLAAQNGHFGAVGFLVEQGADKEAKTSARETALHLAAERGWGRVVLLLIWVGADKEAATGAGETALHLAAQNGHRDVVEFLVEHRANKEFATAAGKAAKQRVPARAAPAPKVKVRRNGPPPAAKVVAQVPQVRLLRTGTVPTPPAVVVAPGVPSVSLLDRHSSTPHTVEEMKNASFHVQKAYVPLQAWNFSNLKLKQKTPDTTAKVQSEALTPNEVLIEEVEPLPGGVDRRIILERQGKLRQSRSYGGYVDPERTGVRTGNVGRGGS
eukprot:g291.t1